MQFFCLTVFYSATLPFLRFFSLPFVEKKTKGLNTQYTVHKCDHSISSLFEWRRRWRNDGKTFHKFLQIQYKCTQKNAFSGIRFFERFKTPLRLSITKGYMYAYMRIKTEKVQREGAFEVYGCVRSHTH